MRLDITAAVGDGLREIMDGLLDRAEKCILSRKGDVHEAVHEARKDLKAFRSYLRLLRPVIGETYHELNARVRDAARALSEARDTQALSDAVDLLEKYRGVRKSSLDVLPLRQAIKADTRKAASQQAIRAAAREVAAMLEPAHKTVQAWQLPSDLAPYVAALTTTYKSAQRHLRHGLATQRAEDLHEARKRVIHWRYQTELFSALWPRVLKAEVRELQDLREDLGQHNDLVLLESRIRNAKGGFKRLNETEPLLAAITELRADRVRAAQHRQALLFSQPPTAVKRQITAWWKAALARKAKA